ncbi:hypothetical protein NVS89_14520 [Ancylobacter sp. MQZ15Z-1]|uniref:Uncharacterized protein n=1 Tax=Ancylobacter mangrovi TaxID=2972472 RepID=A0A9X2PCT5_9HYPH|nr:hypothetical protein [Ancylobacter mangrovi]MCS0496316.1 hypothetical protein [Ancylobacter mangrovi]
MYVLKPGIKRDPVRRWALPDRIFFGHGACYILAGVYLAAPPLARFHAERIIPAEGLPGAHVYVTDGRLAFDYHGYSLRTRLLAHHRRGWAARFEGWEGTVEPADFPLLDTPALNARRMLGPDQYLHDPIPRARAFIARVDHAEAAGRALKRALETAAPDA